MNERLMKELQDSLYVHRPLPLHRDESLEARFIQKKVTAAFPLFPSGDGVQPRLENDTDLHVNDSDFPHGQ